MPVDFSAAAKEARAQLAVPDVDLHSIHERSRRVGARVRLQRVIFSAAIALGAAGTAAAFANIRAGVHVWLFGDNAKVTVQSFVLVRHPVQGDVRQLVAGAAFPVVLPPSLGKDWQPLWIAYAPADKPTMITVQYFNPQTHGTNGVVLVDSDAIEKDPALVPKMPAQVLTSKSYHWHIGRETVLLSAQHESAAFARRLQASMTQRSPADLAAAFESTLPRIRILDTGLQNTPLAKAAQKIAPAGDDVLLGSWQLPQLQALAKHGRSMRDTRIVDIVNVPWTHGRPDYGRATVTFPRAGAIPPDGVRSAAQTLAREHIGRSCRCDVLIHRGSTGQYVLWKIDAKTLKVTRL
jgi:hypothetical protein